MSRRLRVLVAPNAFKGCLTALQAAKAMASGVRRASPDAEIDLMPVSDGGDGLMDVLLARHGGRRLTATVVGPLGEPRRANWGLLAGGREAVVEMARASGIAGIPKDRLDALGATSYGTGQLIARAIAAGARRVLVGMGGSATNDGGAGMAQALGARLLDRKGRELGRGAAELERLARVDVSGLRLRGVEVVGISDVRNPLLGRTGSARVFGPQKGATPAQVARLERALGRYARVLARDLGRDVRRLPGAGAAGGLGAGLAAFCGATLVPGAASVLERLDCARRVARAALVLTGEGRLDAQSFFGKAPVEVARRARARGAMVALLCGAVDASAARKAAAFGPGGVVSLSRKGESLASAMRACKSRLSEASYLAAVNARAFGVALLLATPAGVRAQTASTAAPAAIAIASSTLAESDRLYFSRNVPGHLDKAAAVLREALKPGDDPEALWRLGRCLVRLGERESKSSKKLEFFREAERVSARAVALAPNSPDAHFGLGLSYGRRGETQGIMSSLFLVAPIRREMELTLRLEPKHAGAHHVLGEMLRRLPRLAGGSKKEGLRHLEQAIELEPSHTSVYTDLARAYLDAGKKDKARETLERVLAVKDPEDPAEYPEHAEEARKLLESLK